MGDITASNTRLNRYVSSASVTVQEEDVYEHPVLELWTYTHY